MKIAVSRVGKVTRWYYYEKKKNRSEKELQLVVNLRNFKSAWVIDYAEVFPNLDDSHVSVDAKLTQRV